MTAAQAFATEGRKFKLTSRTRRYIDEILGEVTVYETEALRDFGQFKAGTKGPWVEGFFNLSQNGNAWGSPDSYIIGETALVYGDAYLGGSAAVVNSVIFGNEKVVPGDTVRNETRPGINGAIAVFQASEAVAKRALRMA